MARLNTGNVMPYCFSCLENAKKDVLSPTLKIASLFHDGMGSTKSCNVLSAKEKGVPHIIFRT